MKTLTITATTGSNAPKIAVGVDPIYFMAYTKHRLEMTVVRKAKTIKFKNIDTEGMAKDSPSAEAFIIKNAEVKSIE